MRAVGLKVLKNKLSEYIRLAAGGETVLVTDRDSVGAEIGPPQPGRPECLEDARLAAAVREGWLAPPALLAEDRVPPDDLWNETPVSSRLLEYEVWNRTHGRGLVASHGESARLLIGRIALLELFGPVLRAPSIPSRPSRIPTAHSTRGTWRRSSSCERRASPYSRPPTTSA